jgi:hypothetical protein
MDLLLYPTTQRFYHFPIVTNWGSTFNTWTSGGVPDSNYNRVFSGVTSTIYKIVLIHAYSLQFSSVLNSQDSLKNCLLDQWQHEWIRIVENHIFILSDLGNCRQERIFRNYNLEFQEIIIISKFQKLKKFSFKEPKQ